MTCLSATELNAPGSEACSDLPETFPPMLTLKPTEDRAAAGEILCQILRWGVTCVAEVGRAVHSSSGERLSDPLDHQTRSRERGEWTQEAEGRRWTWKHKTAGREHGRQAQAQPGRRGWRMRSRPHGSAPNAAGRTAGASRAAAGARSW